MSERPIDLLYTTFNRLEFTRASFDSLVMNTDWELVRELTINDDGSTDGTLEWLRENLHRVPVPVHVRETALRSPVAILAAFVESAEAPIVAKVDNDVLLPPHWLRESLAVLTAHPELSMLGIEAIRPHRLQADAPRSFAPSRWISGLGLYRRDAFAASRPSPLHRWFGFEQWLDRQRPSLTVGWLDPAMPLVLLDRVPFEPWRSLTESYVANGWQRPWETYDRYSTLWSWCWPGEVVEPPPVPPYHVVILSANARNAVACVKAVLANEPSLDPSRIIIVDDGARADAEPQLPGVRWVAGDKPFVFARNANLGIAAAGTDVILLNDDAQLVTPHGFRRLITAAQAHPNAGIVSAAVRGVVGNRRQTPRPADALRVENGDTICFICVYLPRHVLDRVGPLDERFTGYGFEDTDYSVRVRQAGLDLAVFDGCVVDHSGSLPSTFRTRRDFRQLVRRNEDLYWDKHRSDGADDSILLVMRVKNESAHIGEVLESALPLCGRAVVFDDRSDDDTVAICRSFGERVEILESPFTNLDEARDKNHILQHVIALAPDWVLWIDGDEVLERRGPARIRDAVRRAGNIGIFSLRVAYCWDGDDQIRVDGIYGRMRRPSLFRLRGQSVRSLYFPVVKPPNLHCGNVPRNTRGARGDLDVRLKHYGYVTPEQRTRKYHWYTAIDPNNAREDHYRHLIGIAGARHAPGPPVIVRWDE